MKASEKIDAAADLIEEKGWFGPWDENHYRQTLGRHCMMTSLGSYEDHQQVIESSLAQAVEDLHDIQFSKQIRTCYALIRFNNTEGRTMQEVLDVMRHAAKLARVSEEEGTQ